jgi:hypothetical protein
MFEIWPVGLNLTKRMKLMMSKLPTRIAIVGTSIAGGGAVLGQQLRRFLEAQGIQVDFYDGNLYTLRAIQKQKGGDIPQNKPILKSVLEEIAASLREKKYPLVIAIEREDIFLEELHPETKRFYYCTCSLSYERYYGWLSEGDPNADKKFQHALEIEKNIYQSADVIIFAWNTYEDFVCKHVYNGSNIATHPGLGWYGCEPNLPRVQYPDFLQMVYLGHIYYWSNPELLAELISLASFPIHCYGRSKSSVSKLDHRGYAKNKYAVYDKYAFGLNTVSVDPLRQAGFSSKIFSYLSVGLPAFSPTWQRFSHQVRGVVPYDVNTFSQLAENNYQRDAWQILSNEAYGQAQDLSWEIVLTPLLDLL